MDPSAGPHTKFLTVPNGVERMLNRIKQFSRVARRCDKTTLLFLSFLGIAASKIWLTFYANIP